jgi:hypothetical protein
MVARGTFQVTVQADPPYDVVEGVALGHAQVDKRFQGPLDATSRVHMIGARTAVDGSAAYVAMERVTGTLDGKTGTFVLQHTGSMIGGVPSLSVVVVANSGTGELTGIAGRMAIEIQGGDHSYAFDYTLGD